MNGRLFYDDHRVAPESSQAMAEGMKSSVQLGRVDEHAGLRPIMQYHGQGTGHS